MTRRRQAPTRHGVTPVQARERVEAVAEAWRDEVGSDVVKPDDVPDDDEPWSADADAPVNVPGNAPNGAPQEDDEFAGDTEPDEHEGTRRRPFAIDGTFDIECSDWDQYALGVFYNGVLSEGPEICPKTGDHLSMLERARWRATVFYDPDDLLDHMRMIGGTVYAHAGGVYDMLLMLERARRRGIACQVDRSQHRVSRIVMGRLVLRDSYGLWPVPLDDISGSLGRKAPELPWRCTCEKRSQWNGYGKRRGCGGYCRISKMARKGDPDLEDYCIDDARDLHDGLTALNAKCTEHKITLRGTLGQTAWISAQDELGVPDSTIEWAQWRHARRADRGGRVAIVRPRASGPGTHHDICNAYPAQLAHAELPVGQMYEVGMAGAQHAFGNASPGIYQASVIVPDDLFLPPLPWMCHGGMYFPTGRFHGTWTLPELVCAIERGVHIEKIHTALVWEATAPIFAPLVKRWYDIRRQVGRKTPFGQWIGRCAKALTGKFAERPNRERVAMHPAEIKICLRRGQCRNGCNGRCGAYVQMDLDGKIWAIPYQRMSPSAYPQWSAYLRAFTRIQWLEQAERYGENLCFGNTDSIWTLGRSSPHPVGDGLGQWEYQHGWTELDVRSASTYAFRELPRDAWPVLDKLATKRAGEPVYQPIDGELKLRGIPGLTEGDWKRGTGLLERGIVTFGSAVPGTKGLFTRRSRKWSLPGRNGEQRLWYADRKLHSSGVTYPPDVEEIREMVAARRTRG